MDIKKKITPNKQNYEIAQNHPLQNKQHNPKPPQLTLSKQKPDEKPKPYQPTKNQTTAPYKHSEENPHKDYSTI